MSSQGSKLKSSLRMTEAYLPEDILHQIFIRMPTKPLIRLKSLSKQWNRLISDPSFMRTRSPRRMIFLPDTPFHTVDNTIINEDMTPSMTKLRFPFGNQEFSKTITVVGSFNGIILLVVKTSSPSVHRSMILYNPLSGEFNTVPDPIPSLNNLHDNTYVYGFGYGTTADDLKIFILRYMDRINGGPKFSSEVFNLKDWSWSIPLELTHNYIFYSDAGTFANGFLYWIARSRPRYPSLILVVLDIKKMVFSEIEVPGINLITDMGTYQGRLCMICYQNNMDIYELWVMNEHEHEQGFARKPWSILRSFKWVSLMEVLCVLEDGKLLMLTNPSKQLAIYDMFKDSYKIVNVSTSFRRVDRIKAVEYVESLISPSDICSTNSVSSSSP